MSEEVKTEAAPVTELSHDALGIFKDPKTSEWVVAIIQYDPLTSEARMVKTIATGGYREMAIDKFKIEAANILFVD